MDTNIFIQAYAKDPINNYVMEDFTLSAEQHNSVCGDMIVIYLKIENESIQEFSYAGAPQMFTLAAASLLAEEITGSSVDEVLGRGYSTMEEWGFVVSPRRRRSTVSALLAVRNALHQWRGDDVVETYATMLP